jgi:hypothetical protein
VLNDHTHEGKWPKHILADLHEIKSTNNKQPETRPGTYKKIERDIQGIKDKYEPTKEKGSKKQVPKPQKRKYKAKEPENTDTP